jgi:hypothetical protein
VFCELQKFFVSHCFAIHFQNEMQGLLLLLLLLLLPLCFGQPFVVTTGRFRANPDTSVSFDWSGVAFSFSLSCNNASSLPVLLFNASSSIASTSQGSHTFRVQETGDVFAFPFAAGNRPTLFNLTLSAPVSAAVTVTKITEALFGIFTLHGVSSPNCIVSRPSDKELVAKNHLLAVEFVGDSLTCGYGVLGTSPCRFFFSRLFLLFILTKIHLCD